MEQKLLDSSQCKEFIKSLIRDKKFENIESLIYYLNNKPDNYNQAFDEFVEIELDWGEEVLTEISNY